MVNGFFSKTKLVKIWLCATSIARTFDHETYRQRVHTSIFGRENIKLN